MGWGEPFEELLLLLFSTPAAAARKRPCSSLAAAKAPCRSFRPWPRESETSSSWSPPAGHLKQLNAPVFSRPPSLLTTKQSRPLQNGHVPFHCRVPLAFKPEMPRNPTTWSIGTERLISSKSIRYSVAMSISSMSLNVLYFMTDTSRGDPDVRHGKKLAATAGERRRAPTRIRRAREDRPRPEGMGDDRLRLAARARRRVFDQAQYDADRQSLERRLKTAAAVRRRRRRRGARSIAEGLEHERPLTRGLSI